MGNTGSKSETELTNFVSSVINICNETIQDCSQKITNTQSLKIINTGGSVNIANIDWKQMVTVSSECVQQAVTSSKAQQKISELISQTTKSINKGLVLPGTGGSDAKDIMHLTTNLATNITNSFTSNCSINALNAQTVTVEDTAKNVTFKAVHWDQTQKALTKCVQATSSSTSAYQALEQSLKQKATAKKLGILSFLGDWIGLVVLLVGIAVIVFVYMFGKSISTLTKSSFIITMFGIIFIILGISSVSNHWPYRKEGKRFYSPSCSPSATVFGCTTSVQYEKKEKSVESTNKYMKWSFIGFGALFIVVALALEFFKSRGSGKSESSDSGIEIEMADRKSK